MTIKAFWNAVTIYTNESKARPPFGCTMIEGLEDEK